MAVPSPGWSLRDLKLRQWVLNHPGACKEVALKCRVSAEYVRLVLYGKRGQGRRGAKKVGMGARSTSVKMQAIVRMLRQKGAPV